MESIGFIGAGNMAYALASGISRQFPGLEILASDVSSERLDIFQSSFETAKVFHSNKEVASRGDYVFLAVKPQIMDTVLSELGYINTCFISIAAGVPIAKLEKLLPNARIVRVMPNTPCLVGQMAAGFSVSPKVTEEDRKIVLSLLETSGSAVEFPEKLLDAVTGVSGSGPAFVARLMEGFIEEAVSMGIQEQAAQTLTYQTFLGTAKLLMEKRMSTDELVNMVSSPGGTTVAGREVLEGSNIKENIRKTVRRAAQRSKELGK
ncbi:MAG: pyrroline-5-carboxylate reductase [Spirochaetia bacterium]